MTKRELTLAKWGFVLLYININLGRWDILPDFLGIFLLYLSLGEKYRVADSGTVSMDRQPVLRKGGAEKRLIPFLSILGLDYLVHWFISFTFALEILIVYVVRLYVMYTYFGILVERIEAGGQPDVADRFRKLRIAYVVLWAVEIISEVLSLDWILLALVFALIAFAIVLFVQLGAVKPISETA